MRFKIGDRVAVVGATESCNTINESSARLVNRLKGKTGEVVRLPYNEQVDQFYSVLLEHPPDHLEFFSISENESTFILAEEELDFDDVAVIE